MYNYYPYNCRTYHPRIECQQSTQSLHVGDAEAKGLGHGFIRYQWNQGVNIRAGERKGIHLIAHKIQVIISAGWRVTKPSELVLATTLAPTMINGDGFDIILQSYSNIEVNVVPWLIVKNIEGYE